MKDDRPLKIGIACYPTYGGSGVVATELGLALAEKGHEIHLLSYGSPIRLTRYHPNVHYHQVVVQEYPLFRYPPYALALAAKMADVIEERDLDVLHVHYAIPHAASALMARSMCRDSRIRVVVTLHGTDITIVGNDPAYRRVTRYCLEEADAVTAVSNSLAEETSRSIDTDTQIAVVSNFVDLERFNVSSSPSPKEAVCLHISNFRPVKRVCDLVRAFKLALDRGAEGRLVLVGEGPDRPAAQSLAVDLGMGDRVDFRGPQDDVEKLLPQATVFALPSEYESFGLAALEAMACGVGVLATRTGGVPEVVEDGVTGILCEVGDISALAGGLARFLNEPELATRMGQAARARAEKVFSLARVLPGYEAIYRGIAASV
jgi:N-acetyl-alpha-D-glucosaminyl L-malate synthase BshA